MKTVVLKNGSEEVESLVLVAMNSLKSLMETSPIAFYELVMKCRDRNHQCFGNTLEILKRLALIQEDGDIHDSMKNIILSSVVGNELEMRLTNPY